MLEAIKDAVIRAHNYGICLSLDDITCPMELESEIRFAFSLYGYDEDAEEICNAIVRSTING